MATNENIRVVQLTDDNDNPVSPVVNVGSLYDKNGNKVDNLLSYKVAGTNVPVPEIKNIQDELTQKVDKAILDMKTQVEAFTMNGGLPVNDVRSAKVASGESISAGDVVDIDNSGCAAVRYGVTEEEIVDYDYNLGEQPTRIKVSNSNTPVIKVSDDLVCTMGDFGEYSGSNAYILNSVGAERDSLSVGVTGAHFSVAKYTSGTDTLIMILNADQIAGLSSEISTRFITVTNTGSASIGGYNSSRKTLDGARDFILASFVNRNDGVLAIIGNSVYRYYKNTGTQEPLYANIGTLKMSGTLSKYSICSLGNNVSGCEGFLLSYYNSTDKKTYLVAFTVNNSSNALTVGTPVVLSSVANAVAIIRKTSSGNIVGVIKESASTSYIFTAQVSTRTVTVKNKVKILSGITTTNLVDFNHLDGTKFAVMYSNDDSGMYVKTLTYSGNTVVENKPHTVKGTTASDLVKTTGAIAGFGDKFVAITSYSNGNYKLHGVSLENRDDLYGKEIHVDSRQAIALESGSSGDTISVGYGGYCRMTGVTEGTKIESNGVCAVSPVDGWLDVTPKYRSISTGTYIGTGNYGESNACKISGVKDAKAVILTVSQSSRWGCDPVLLTRTSYSEGAFAITSSMYSGIGETGSTRCNMLYYKFDGDSLIWYSSTDPNQFNASGDVYSFIIIR